MSNRDETALLIDRHPAVRVRRIGLAVTNKARNCPKFVHDRS